MTTHAEAARSSSLNEICNDVFADRLNNLTDEKTGLNFSLIDLLYVSNMNYHYVSASTMQMFKNNIQFLSFFEKIIHYPVELYFIYQFCARVQN